jgi:metallophosphoesterase superfamily enzyme
MRIIHTGDIHIGAAFENLPQEKAEIKKAELLENFRRVCSYAKEERVGAVLIAGDLFDTARVEKQVMRETFAAIESAAGVPFFYVKGNHDESLDFAIEPPKNLYLFKNGFQSYALSERVRITGADMADCTPQTLENLRLSQEDFNILLLHGDIKTEIPLSKLSSKGVD